MREILVLQYEADKKIQGELAQLVKLEDPKVAADQTVADLRKMPQEEWLEKMVKLEDPKVAADETYGSGADTTC